MASTQVPTKSKKEAVNLNLTIELNEWLQREANRLMTSKATVARIVLEKAMRESEKGLAA